MRFGGLEWCEQQVVAFFLIHAQVPVHISLYDASGDGAVIEFDGEKVRKGSRDAGRR